MDSRRTHLIVLLSLHMLCLVTATPCGAQNASDPAEVAKDPDFSLQGEYADTKRGLQAIARGDGEFEVVVFEGGLPGAGWDGKQKNRLDVDADTLEGMLEQFERVERKSPTLEAKPPRGAVVLFDGTQQSIDAHWKPGATIVDGNLLKEGCTTTDTFGDYRLHLEFRLPFMPKAQGQQRGNSGVYHQGRFETQVLDSFGLEGKNNEAGGLYSIRDPDMNACLPPMVWQTYDVEFTASRWDDNGKKLSNAKITVMLNGFVVHRDVELPRKTTAAPLNDGPGPGPIYLQNHGNPVRYRNIWVLPRDVEAEARRPIVPAFERFHATAGDPADGGRLMIAELNCVACHKADDPLLGDLNPKQAPILDDVGDRVRPKWMLKYLANPHDVKPGTTMPDLLAGMSDQEREAAALALTNFLVGQDAVLSGGKGGNTNAGKALFHESGCVACHQPMDGRKVSSATSIPLVALGEKYTRASLAAFLKDPLAIRPSGRMPKLDLGGDNWLHVSQYLTGDEEVTLQFDPNLPPEPNMVFEAYDRRVDQLPDLSQWKPDRTGVSRGLDITAGKRDQHVVLRFTGDLPITNAGTYRFSLRSDDGSRLYIDDERVIDNDGVHGEVTVEGKHFLSAGVHRVRVEWFELEGGEALKLQWSGPGISSSRLDHALVMPESGAESAVTSKPLPSDPDAFVYDQSQAETGRRLFTSLGCADCHVRNENDKRIKSERTAPRLNQLPDSGGCLANSATTPNFDLIGRQSDAIVAALRELKEPGPYPAEARAIHSMKALNCFSCHVRDGIGGPESDRNRLFTSTIPEMGDEGRLPPPLNGVGDKLRRDWMRQVIADGKKSRPYMKFHMPAFGPKAADQLAAHFEKTDLISEPHGKVLEEEQEKRRVRFGRKLVGAKGLACVSCHTFGKFKSTGIQAIALDTMATRIREDWFHRYLPNPQKYRPGTRMPTGFPKGESTVKDVYDGDRDLQLTAIWSFLEKGTAGGIPEGISGGMIELKPTDKPVLYRNFIQGSSPRGIAVGYPEAANLCWDADTMSLSLIWQERFIDAAKHWVGRGQGNQSPLGVGLVQVERISAFAQLSSESEPWPTAPPRDRGYRFLGYQLDELGRPTFRYQADEVLIEDKPVAIVGELGGTFRREFKVSRLSDAKPGKTLYFRAAVGNIESDADGWYTVNNEYRTRLSVDVQLRTSNGQSELLVPINSDTEFTQEIDW